MREPVRNERQLMPNPTSPGLVHRNAIAMIGLAAALAACSAEHPPIDTCEPGDGIIPDCRFQNPEDLVPSPDGRFLIISQFGSMEGGKAGSLVALDLQTDRVETLFPVDGVPAGTAGQRWGDPDCGPPPVASFSPHGIDIEQLNSGAQALYVVNHGDGGRESIEMFEVEEAGDVSLTWRGCVLAPEQGFFNDVVALRDGGFWVSHMYPRDANVLWTALRMQFTGHTPGFAYRWSRNDGFQPIPGSESRFANGVEKSADERYLFVNEYFGDAVKKVDVRPGQVVGSAEVSSPDNLAWSPEGELIAASHVAPLGDLMSCQELESGSCGFQFQVVVIDPETMSTRVALDHAGPPMGGATVALPHGEWVWLGTFAGDRIARVPVAVLANAAVP